MPSTVKHYLIAIFTIIAATAGIMVVGLIVQVESAENQTASANGNFQHFTPDLNLPQPARSYLDINYCRTTDSQQTLDIFAPAYQPKQPAPVLIFVHGGGWSSSGKRNGFIEYYKKQILDRGIALVSINHRLAPQHIFPSQNQDVACAIEFIHRQANLYGLDGNRLALFGESSGAQLITAAALQDSPSKQAWQNSIKAVVSFYGISDFKSLLTDKGYRGNARTYLGTNPQIQAMQASVIYKDLYQPPPFFIIHGDKDPIVPASQSIALYKHLQKFNTNNQLLLIKGAGHGITMKNKPNSEQLRSMVLNYLQQQFTPGPVQSAK